MKILNRLIDIGLRFVDTLWSFSLSPSLYFAENHHPLSTGMGLILCLCGFSAFGSRSLYMYD